MKSASLVTAASIILVANALALFHAAHNRVGTPESDITLTNRELRYFAQSATDDDSGVTLQLQWTDPSLHLAAEVDHRPKWLDRQKLQTLGFDCSVDPGSSGAARFYRRQRPRQVFAALEYDGPAWRVLAEEYERARELAGSTFKRQGNAESNDSTVGDGSHLVAVDADLNPLQLRARHPDRRSVLILPVVVAVTLGPFQYYGVWINSQHPPQITGRIQELPSSIHVPLPLSDEFRLLGRSQHQVSNNLSYSVHLSYGSSLEPWVTGVKFTDRQ
jgi:hypothetical protein